MLTAGAITGSANFNGTYPEFNLRNNSNANTVFGNDVEIVGTGAVVFNAVTDTGGGGISATSNITSTLGNLKIGDGQEVTVQKNTTTGIRGLPVGALYKERQTENKSDVYITHGEVL